MANFIKDSMAELEHVVWPTHIETKKFFQAVVGIIAAMALFTYLLTVIFSNGLFGLRAMIQAPKAADLSGSPVTIDANNVKATTADGKPADIKITETK